MTFVFAVPGSLDTPTGGYAYARRVIAELERRGVTVEVIDLGEGFPRPAENLRIAALERIAALPPDHPVVVDGLAFGVLPDLPARARRHRIIGLVHHPLALETGLSAAAAAAFKASERAALAGACHVIATSTHTARLLADDYAVAATRMTVAPPGTDRVSPARGSPDGVPALIAVGSLVPRKGYDVLVAALAKVADLPWRLTIVGDPGRDPKTAAAIAADIAQAGLSQRITLAGAVSAERLDALYRASDLFVLASHFEGYGMAYTEAIAYGLPVVGTKAGAIPDTVGACALLIDAGDVSGLALALRSLLSNPALRAQLTGRAREMAARLPTWENTADLFAGAVASVAATAASTSGLS